MSSSCTNEESVLRLENIDIYHVRRTVGSTQDEVRRLLDDYRPRGSLAVVAENQSDGRGTNGRTWVATEGNLFLSVAVPMQTIPTSRWTLLPLGVGLAIAQTVESLVTTKPTLKWPNDVLIDGMKISGTLIENHRSSEHEFLIVGVGVNVLSHPEELPSENEDFRYRPRAATCLKHYLRAEQNIPEPYALGTRLAVQISSFSHELHGIKRADFIYSWKSWSDFSVRYELRESGEILQIIDIEDDGRLLVLDERGNERLLISDYFS